MNCRDFEPTWNDWLDDRCAGNPERAKSLEIHAATCSRCLPVHARYLLLSQALRVVGPLPAVSENFADRVLTARDLPEVVRFGRVYPRLRRFSALALAAAAAAVLLVAASFGFRAWLTGPGQDLPDRAIALKKSAGPAPFTEALAVATSTTLELAREASAPAARDGYELASAELTESTPSTTLGISVDMAPATEALQRVGNRLNAGVRPLEGSARRAFGFLLSPRLDNPKPPPRSPQGA